MSDLVAADKIEGIVGVERHPTEHYARAVSAEQTVYILHSQECRDQMDRRDLRDCPFSYALDNGIDVDEWTEDVALIVAVVVRDGVARLVPADPVVGCSRRGRQGMSDEVERIDNMSHWSVEATLPVGTGGRNWAQNITVEVVAADIHRAIAVFATEHPGATIHVVRKTSRWRTLLIDRAVSS